jgi:hypothetical protein
VKGELSEQDKCWVKYTDHNRCDVVDDPAGTERKVMKIVNANDWSADCGYGLNLNIPAETAADFDVVCSADIYIPSTFVDRPEEQHSEAYFLLSQDDAHRMNDVTFYLDDAKAGLPVALRLNDIENTSWWEEHAASSVPVENGAWFAFSERFNCELIDYEYKTLISVVFGENEYEMEDADSRINYPDGIDDEVLNNEYLKAFKLWCGVDNAGVCLDNFQIRLVPKGVPEPALLGFALLLALAFARKQK